MDKKTKADVLNWTLFTGTITFTTILVIILYGWLYGYDFLGRYISSPNITVSAWQGQHTVQAQPHVNCPPGTTYPGVLPRHAPPVYSRATVSNTSTGQYICPTHGAVGMPFFRQNGIPQCPVGGGIMQFHTQ